MSDGGQAAKATTSSPTAAYDQLGATMRDLAIVHGEFFKALVRHGFTRPEALELVRDWQGDYLDR